MPLKSLKDGEETMKEKTKERVKERYLIFDMRDFLCLISNI